MNLVPQSLVIQVDVRHYYWDYDELVELDVMIFLWIQSTLNVLFYSVSFHFAYY